MFFLTTWLKLQRQNIRSWPELSGIPLSFFKLTQKKKENVNMLIWRNKIRTWRRLPQLLFVVRAKKLIQHLGLNVFNYRGLEYTVKLNSIKWKTGFMTAEMSEREKSELKSVEYGKEIIHKQFFLKKRSNVHAVYEEVLGLAYY